MVSDSKILYVGLVSLCPNVDLDMYIDALGASSICHPYPNIPGLLPDVPPRCILSRKCKLSLGVPGLHHGCMTLSGTDKGGGDLGSTRLGFQDLLVPKIVKRLYPPPFSFKHAKSAYPKIKNQKNSLPPMFSFKENLDFRELLGNFRTLI